MTHKFDEVVRRVRDCLQPIAAAPRAQPPALGDGSIRGLVSIFPLRPGHETLLRSAIEDLPSGPVDSPFRLVPGTHFARLALLDRDTVGRHPRKFVPLRNSYLLFAADFDGTGSLSESGERYFRSMHRAIPNDVGAVWSHCVGFDGADDQQFSALAALCRRRVLREYIDYPEESLRSVLTALTSQRVFVELVQRRGRGSRIAAGAVTGFLGHQPFG